MSIKTTPTTSITVDSTELDVDSTIKIDSSSISHCVDIIPPQEVVAIKKEYSIVGDAFYAGINSETAPTWLTNLIDAVVSASVSNGLTNYDLLVQDVRNAIDAIDIAQNTYVEQIGFNALVDGIIGSHLTTLNTTYDGKFATIAALETVKTDSESALATTVTDLQAEFSEEINSRITTVETAYANADQANANSITALTTSFEEQEEGLQAAANAVSGLQTFVGLDSSSSNPNGTGLLSRIDTLERQTDGTVEFLSNTYDVMIGIEDPNNDTDNDQLIVDALPFVQWTNMSGTGAPVSILRPYVDYSLETPASADVAVLEGTLYTRLDFTDVNVDKYYEFTSGSWSAITESDFVEFEERVRYSHTGDVYIMYSNDGGSRNYIRSYKFIKGDIDNTSPYATDTEGYGWALVSDTDAQAAYNLALQARDMADGKISSFYAWGDMDGGGEPADYNVTAADAKYSMSSNGDYLDSNEDITTNPDEYVVLTPATVETISAANVVLWFTGGMLYRKGTSWADKAVMPTAAGNGSYVSEGDLLTVFNPSTGDTTTYHYLSGSWALNGPADLLSKSKWFVDLSNAVTGANGHLARSVSNVNVTSKAFTNQKVASVENQFRYDSKIILDGQYYESGFGMSSEGLSQVGKDGSTEETAFNSEFWVNAERFVLKSPQYPGVSASFSISAFGIKLGVEHTEATANSTDAEIRAGTTKANVGLGSVDNTSDADIRAVAAATSGTMGSWNISTGYIYSGAPGTEKKTDGYATSGITLSSAGAIRAKNFRLDVNGDAYFRGEVTVSSLTFEDGVTISYSEVDGGPPSNATANQSDTTTNNAISNAANTANWDDVTGSNKPADNATANQSDADALDAANKQDKTDGSIAGWSLDANYIWSGIKKTTDGFSASGITLFKDGSFRSKNFYIDGGTGQAVFKGDMSAGSINGMRIKIGSFPNSVDGDMSVNITTYEGRSYSTNGAYTSRGSSTPFTKLLGVSLSHLGPSQSSRDMNFPTITGANKFNFNRDNGYDGTEYFSFIAYGY